MGSFLDENKFYTLNPVYYLTQVMMFLYPMIVHISMIKALINGLRGQNINNFIRFIFRLLGFCFSFLWWSLGLIKINLLVFGISDHKYIDYLMIFARNLVLPINIPPFIAALSPWLCKKFYPLYTKLEKIDYIG